MQNDPRSRILLLLQLLLKQTDEYHYATGADILRFWEAHEDGTVLTAGGRVLGVTAVGGDLEEAIEKAYAACKPISFQDMHFRTDIGKV